MASEKLLSFWSFFCAVSRCQLKGMLNEAAETKAWWNGFDDAGCSPSCGRLRPLSSRRWTAPSNSCRKQRPLWKRSRTLNVMEFRSWRSRQLFIVEDAGKFSEDFVGLVTRDEKIITSNMRNQMGSPCLLQSSGECSD